MPHLTIEYSKGVTEQASIDSLCTALHREMLELDIFPNAGIRVRAYQADFAIVADGLPENNFVAITLSVGAGRSTEVLKSAGDQIFAKAEVVLATFLATQYFALSMEIREINADLSWKNTPIHARLSGKDK